MPLTIKPNCQERKLFYFEDFNESEQQKLRIDYDWMGDDIEANFGFFVYHGEIYHLGDFTSLHGKNSSEEFKGWDGIVSDSYFSGVIIKLTENNDAVIVGRYYN